MTLGLNLRASGAHDPKFTDCMDKRNKYMVDQSDVIIAVWSGRPSGTGKTVQYAQSQGKPIVTINPNSLKIGNDV